MRTSEITPLLLFYSADSQSQNVPLVPHYFKSASPRRGHVAIHAASLLRVMKFGMWP